EGDLLRLLKLASEAPWPMRDSPQPIVHLEAAVLQMATLEPGETLARLLARLEALDRRVSGEPPGGGAGGARAGGPPPPGGARAGTGAPGPRAAAAPPAPRFAPPPGATQAVAGAPAGGRAAGAPAGLAEPGYERDDAVDRRWRDTLLGVNASKRMLGAFLEESVFLGLAEETLVL